MRWWNVRTLSAAWVVACLLAWGGLSHTALFTTLEDAAEDSILRSGRRPKLDPRIVIVKIDQASLRDKRLGLAPWRPKQYAAILRRLKQLGAEVVGFDIVMEHVYEPDDLSFARELASGDTKVVLTSHWTTDQTAGGIEERWTLPAKAFRRPDDGRAHSNVRWGFINFSDSYVRDTLLCRPDPIFEDEAVSSFAMTVAASRGDVDLPERWPPAAEVDAKRTGPQMKFVPNPTGFDSASCRIHFAGPAGTIPSINVQELMGLVQHPRLEELIDGATVLVGATAPEYHDLFGTPVNVTANADEAAMAGVEIHANIVNQLHQGQAPQRCDTSVAWIWTIVSSLVCLVVLLSCRPLLSSAMLPVTLVAIGSATQFAFNQWLLFLPTSGPMFVVTVGWVGGVLIRWMCVDRQRRKLRKIFSRCLHESVIADLLERQDAVTLAGQKREVTVFFCDIGGFTQMSERIPPEHVVARLQTYFEAMCEEIYAHNGAVDKFIGDAIMAFFGTPHDDEQHAQHAVQAALAMQRRLRQLNEEWAADGLPPLEIYFGVSTGPVIAGMLGSKQKMEYTVIGDTVNMASRLESLNRSLSTNILITAETRRRLDDDVLVAELGPTPIRGKSQPVDVYAVLDEETNEFLNQSPETLPPESTAASKDAPPAKVIS